MREFKNITHALFQARMWRKYAMMWDEKPGIFGAESLNRRWMEHTMRISRAECIARAREAAAAARQFNLSSGKLDQATRLS